MTADRFRIYINRTGELIGELDSWKTAHRIAHLYLGEWPDFSPLAVNDRILGTVRFVKTGKCDPLDCDVITLIPHRGPVVGSDMPPDLLEFLRHFYWN